MIEHLRFATDLPWEGFAANASTVLSRPNFRGLKRLHFHLGSLLPSGIENPIRTELRDFDLKGILTFSNSICVLSYFPTPYSVVDVFLAT
jgi:hypothetical protein